MTLASLALLLACLGGTRAIACLPNYCEKVSCDYEALACPDGALKVPKTSYCGCCPSCITYLGLGDPCTQPQDGLTRCLPTMECDGSFCVDPVIPERVSFDGA